MQQKSVSATSSSAVAAAASQVTYSASTATATATTTTTATTDTTSEVMSTAAVASVAYVDPSSGEYPKYRKLYINHFYFCC